MDANGTCVRHMVRWALLAGFCGWTFLTVGCGGPASPEGKAADPPQKTASVTPVDPQPKSEEPPKEEPAKQEPTKGEPTKAEPKRGEPTPAEPGPGDPVPKVALPTPENLKTLPKPPEPPPPVSLEKLNTWKVVRKFDYGLRVSQVAFSPEGDLLAAAGAGDRQHPPVIQLWNTSDWSPAGELAGHTELIASFVFSPAKPQLISAGGVISRDSELKVWDLKTKMAISLQGHGGVVGGLAIDSTGGLLATAGETRVIRLWDLNGKLGPSTRPFGLLRGHEDTITSVAFSPDVKFLVSTSTDYTVRIWVVAEGRLRTRLKGHGHALTACAFTPDGERFLSVDAGGEVRMWDVFTLNELAFIKVANREVATSVSISPDSKLAAVGLATGEFALIDLEARKALGVISGHEGYVNSVAFAPDGRLVTGGEDGQVLVWEKAK